MLLGKCCCGCGVFDWSEGDTLDPWEQVAGSWSYNSTRLETSDTDGLLIADRVHPLGNGAPRVLDVFLRVNGEPELAGRPRLVIDYVDADNFTFAEILIDGATSTLRLGQTVAGVESILTSAAVDFQSDSIFRACWNGSEISAAVSGNFSQGKVRVWHTLAALPGQRVGLGTGSDATAIHFEDFDWYYHDSASRPECESCVPSSCCGGTPPAVVKVVLEGDYGETEWGAALPGTWLVPLYDQSSCIWRQRFVVLPVVWHRFTMTRRTVAKPNIDLFIESNASYSVRFSGFAPWICSDWTDHELKLVSSTVITDGAVARLQLP